MELVVINTLGASLTRQVVISAKMDLGHAKTVKRDQLIPITSNALVESVKRVACLGGLRQAEKVFPVVDFWRKAPTTVVCRV